MLAKLQHKQKIIQLSLQNAAGTKGLGQLVKIQTKLMQNTFVLSVIHFSP